MTSRPTRSFRPMACPPTIVELVLPRSRRKQKPSGLANLTRTVCCREIRRVLCEFDRSAVALIEQNAGGRPISRASPEYVAQRIPHSRYNFGTTEREKRRFAGPKRHQIKASKIGSRTKTAAI